MLKGAIFDHDGLMFDTEKVWQYNWQKQAAANNIILPERFKYDISGTSGSTMKAVIEKYYRVPDGTEIMHTVIDHVHHDLSLSLEEKKGLHEILKMFRAKGIIIAVASSSDEEMIRRNLNKAGIEQYFQAVVSSHHLARSKPAPDVFLEAAKQIHLDPAECYVFEDAINGVKAGYAAGCRTIMIPDMTLPDEETKQKASAIYPSLIEAMKAIEEGRI